MPMRSIYIASSLPYICSLHPISYTTYTCFIAYLYMTHCIAASRAHILYTYILPVNSLNALHLFPTQVAMLGGYTPFSDTPHIFGCISHHFPHNIPMTFN